MLVNNSGQNGYYPDPRGVIHSSQHPPHHQSADIYYDHPNLNRTSQSHHAHHYYENQEGRAMMIHPQDCMCQRRPVQETFLHQILMGKGYKNDCLYVNRPMKPEIMYGDYGNCCYSSMSYHTYQHLHPGH